MEEQEEIVSVLDKLDQLVEQRKQQLSKLDELVKARFVEMFGDVMSNPKGWPISELSEYILFLTSGSRGWAQYFTDNGEYFIIDAGQNHAYNYIYDKLLELNGGEDVTVACWLFTHFHNDHIGGFVNLCENDEMMKRIHVKSVIYNFPSRQVLDTAPGAGDQMNVAKWEGLLDKHGILRYQARTGQKYYFGNAVVEILGTYDDIMPFFVRNDNTNHTCIIFCIDIEGQRIMVTGDATTPEFNVCAARYGDYLKSEILQVSHHGMGDGSKDTTFYEKVNAPVVLIPGSVATNAQEWAKNNAKEYYFRVNGTKTWILPYEIAE
jgi:beta-lactamase superfamily II metal-dependent hydrolase